MFFRKPETHLCAVCGKPIEPKAPRFVDKSRITKAERHVHQSCRKATTGSTFVARRAGR